MRTYLIILQDEARQFRRETERLGVGMEHDDGQRGNLTRRESVKH